MCETFGVAENQSFEWQAGTDDISLRDPAQGLNANRHPAILSTAGSPVKTYQWPESGPVLGESAAVSGLSLSGCCPNCGHDGASLRMFVDSYLATAELTSPLSSTPWLNSGSMVSRGRFWTRSTSESRNAAAACSLSAVLEPQVSERYYLSVKAAEGILRRAEKQGKTLPTQLERALKDIATTETETTT